MKKCVCVRKSAAFLVFTNCALAQSISKKCTWYECYVSNLMESRRRWMLFRRLFYSICSLPPSPVIIEDRSIANYKIRNHYFGGEDALSLSFSLHTHQIKNIILCCSFCRLYIFFAICYNSNNNTVGPTVAQVHKVFE